MKFKKQTPLNHIAFICWFKNLGSSYSLLLESANLIFVTKNKKVIAEYYVDNNVLVYNKI